MSCIPWLSKFYIETGDCGNVDTESENSAENSERSCPSADSDEDRRRSERWRRRGQPCPLSPRVSHVPPRTQ